MQGEELIRKKDEKINDCRFVGCTVVRNLGDRVCVRWGE